MISNNTIQKIFDYARIEEVIGDFVRLKKSGVNYKGLCPFHNEKTPSFMVSPTKNIFKCFGCGESGNPITFVMKHEKYSYPEALRYLAEKYAIEIEEESSSTEDSQQIEEKESLFNLNSFAQKFFSEKLLYNETGQAIALSYLKQRGISKREIEKFLLGYSPDIWDAFTQHAVENGFTLPLLEKSGLVIFKDTNNCYDRFKGRIIFPVQNLTGRIVGFGGRLIGKNDNKAKYVNSPETEIYNKSKILYGLYQAKTKISQQDNCYLVEGYTDVIAMHRAKIENVVASSGTSLTKDQVRLLKRYTHHITILFDSDAAGVNATSRGIDLILEEGLNVKIVLFPEGDDPDSFVRKHTTEETKSFLEENAVDFITYKTKLLLEQDKNDPVKKAGFIKEIINTIALIPDPITRSVYVKNCSLSLDIDEEALQSHLSRELRRKSRKKLNITEPEPEPPLPKAEKQISKEMDDASDDEKNIIRFLIHYANETISFIKPQAAHKEKHQLDDDDIISSTVAAYIVNEIKKDGLAFDSDIFQKIFDEIATSVADNQKIPPHFFLNHADEIIKETTINLSMEANTLSDNWKNKHQILVPREETRIQHFAIWFLDNFRTRKLFRLLKENSEKIKNSKSDEEIKMLIEKQMKLINIKNKIGKKMKRVFLK